MAFSSAIGSTAIDSRLYIRFFFNFFLNVFLLVCYTLFVTRFFIILIPAKRHADVGTRRKYRFLLATSPYGDRCGSVLSFLFPTTITTTTANTTTTTLTTILCVHPTAAVRDKRVSSIFSPFRARRYVNHSRQTHTGTLLSVVRQFFCFIIFFVFHFDAIPHQPILFLTRMAQCRTRHGTLRPNALLLLLLYM